MHKIKKKTKCGNLNWEFTVRGFHYCATNLSGMSIANEMLNRSGIL